jgi:hypothetical protein
VNKILFILFVLFLQSISFSIGTDTVFFPSQSNEDKSPVQYYIMGGPVAAFNELGISVSPAFSCHNILYSLSGTISSEFNLFGPSPTEATEELSFLIGKKHNYKYGYFSLSAGLSYLHMLRRGKLLIPGGGGLLSSDEYEAKDYSLIGVPIKAEAVAKFYYAGVGIQIILNINKISPSFGVGPIFYLGTYKNPTFKR